MLKAGIIRCQQTEDMCSADADFKAAREGTGSFQETGPVEIVGFITCGGCPGKRAVPRAKLMVERGAEVIAFASCISKGNPIEFPCPFFTKMRDAVPKKIGTDIRILEWTH